MHAPPDEQYFSDAAEALSEEEIQSEAEEAHWGALLKQEFEDAGGSLGGQQFKDILAKILPHNLSGLADALDGFLDGIAPQHSNEEPRLKSLLSYVMWCLFAQGPWVA